MIPHTSFPWDVFAVAFIGYQFWRGLRYLATLQDIIRRQRRVRQELMPGSPQGMPGLDMARLEQTTREVESLGFERLEDYFSRSFDASETSSVNPLSTPPIADPLAPAPLSPRRFQPQGFGRVFVHREHGCLAKIIFVAVRDAEGKVAPNTSFSLVMNSASGWDDSDWGYTTTNRGGKTTMNALMKILRHPRRLSTRMPGATPHALLETHLARRQGIAQVAGISWKRNLSMADDYSSEARGMENIHKVYGRLSPLSFAWRLFWLKRERELQTLEWLGELQGRI